MKKKILVVDDDPSIRECLTHILSGAQYTVLPAAFADEALAIAGATEVDLVLLDLNLPDKTGWDTFERLSNDNPLLPIVILTGRANQVFTALAAGAGALLEKPVDVRHLLQTVQRLLAEPAEKHLQRLTGQAAEFDYFPALRRQATAAGG